MNETVGEKNNRYFGSLEKRICRNAEINLFSVITIGNFDCSAHSGSETWVKIGSIPPNARPEAKIK